MQVERQPDQNIKCKTKYPVLLVHGAGFRDNSFNLNYWGRIPEALESTGTRVFYGNHDAWCSITDSAKIIAAKIDEIIKSTDCQKVNIIAHSKGGLDCRYLISSMKYSDKIASLVTISTPHHGSLPLNILLYLPQWLISFISVFVNLAFGILGDKNPNFGKAAMELSQRSCEEFNRTNTDDDGVYYESYGTRMKSPFNDALFFFLNITIRLFEKDNDGLVAFESAKWTNFSELSPDKKGVGFSHADVVDLRRRDRWGFDIRSFYKGIILKLSTMGL